MLLSYQNIIENVETIFNDRPQVNSVDIGQDLEFDIKKTNLFPRVFIKTIESPYNGRWEFSLSILCIDLVQPDFSNVIDTMSLCHSILADAISEMNYQDIIDPNGLTLIPVYQYQDTQGAGWTLNVTIFTQKGLECNNAIP